MAVNTLIQEYAGQPVVLVEYDVLHIPFERNARYEAAWYGSGRTGYAGVPRDMVDSGNQFKPNSGGTGDNYTDYKAMIESSRVRPPLADVSAITRRMGDQVEFRVRVKNLSGGTLSLADNMAGVHGVVYENAKVTLMNQGARETGMTWIQQPLAAGQTMTYTVTASSLYTDTTTFGWNKMRAFALVDYQPSGPTGAYDMLQAAIAPAPMTSSPSTSTFDVGPGGSRPVAVTLSGPTYVSWRAETDRPWLMVTPSGAAAVQPVVTVNTGLFASGWQEGTVYFRAVDSQGQEWSSWMTARAYGGELKKFYLPALLR